MDWQARLSALLDHDWIAYYLLPGVAAATLALLGWRLERRRKTRSEPDAVGLLDWNWLIFWASFAALVLFGAAVKGWLTTDVPLFP